MLAYDENGIRVYCALIPIPSRGEARGIAERKGVEMLLSEAFPGNDAPEVRHDPSGAPVLCGADEVVSVSHCGGMVCIALACGRRRIGVDAETMSRGVQLRRVAGRFLAPSQIAAWGCDGQRLLKAWTIKEALYKAVSESGLALCEIPLPQCDGNGEDWVAFRGTRYSIMHIAVDGFDGILTLAVEI